jgi:hypothetical protein
MSEAEEKDLELEAISTILGVLTPLKPDARANVIDYVFRRLGIVAPVVQAPSSPSVTTPPPNSAPVLPAFQAGQPNDLRTLTEQKQPKTANQMVAIVAYYLANLAPQNERRDYMIADDIKKYFVQANFELPTAPPRITLANAKNAGYLDAQGEGRFRLNPVGHNLVSHKLPKTDGSGRTRTSKKAKKAKPTKKARK